MAATRRTADRPVAAIAPRPARQVERPVPAAAASGARWGRRPSWPSRSLGGSLALLWSAVARRPTPKVRVGTLADLIAANAGPAGRRRASRLTSPEARAFVMTLDPARAAGRPGIDPTGDGTALNVRALSQRLPAPRLSAEPVHRGLLVPLPVPPVALRPARDQAGRRAVRPGATGDGPLRRSRSTRDGVLTVDTSHVMLGPLPVALGQPGADPAAGPATAAADERGRRPVDGAPPAARASSGSIRGAWRARYEAEMLAVLEQRELGPRGRLDLVRGALDAWLHRADRACPRSRRCSGGGLWTFAGAGVVAQPVPPDWPGYLVETLPLALVAVVAGLRRHVGLLGCAERRGRASRRRRGPRWRSSATSSGRPRSSRRSSGSAYGPPTAVAQAARRRSGACWSGSSSLAGGRRADRRPARRSAPAVVLFGWPVAWLGFGLAWTLVGRLAARSSRRRRSRAARRRAAR